MTFYKFGLVALLLLTCVGATAQKNFVAGYVVDHAGDTIRGFVDDKNWIVNPSVIYFKKEVQAEPVAYVPTEIKAFRLSSGEYFKAKAVKYDQSAFKLQELGEEPNPQWKQDTLFLRVEVEGLVHLYYFLESNDKEHFFLEKNEAGADELLNVRYNAYQNGVKRMTATQQYKSQLKNYLGDCDALSGKIYSVKYGLEPIRNVVKQYNRCHGASDGGQVLQERRNSILQAGLIAGVHATNLRFRSELSGFEELTDGAYRDALNGVGGAVLDVYIPRGHRQFLFHNELVYKVYNATKVVEKQASLANPYSKEDTYFRMRYLQANLMFRYHRATFTKVRPFVQAGVVLGRSIKATSLTRTETTYSSGATYHKEAPALADLGKFTSGYAGGLGVTVGKFGVEARYERAAGLSIYEGLWASARSVYFLASYTLR